MSRRTIKAHKAAMSGRYVAAMSRPIHDGDVITVKYEDRNEDRTFMVKRTSGVHDCRRCPFSVRSGNSPYSFCGLIRRTRNDQLHRICVIRGELRYGPPSHFSFVPIDSILEDL